MVHLVDESDSSGGAAAAASPVKLISKDGEEFKVSREYAMISTRVSDSLRDQRTSSSFINDAAENVGGEVRLEEVCARALGHIVEYMDHHQGTEPPILERPLRSKRLSDVCSDRWDADYIDRIGDNSRVQLYELIIGANYMGVNSLLHLGCAKVASLIKGQPLERIRELLAPREH